MFKIGEKVVVKDSGQNYTTWESFAEGIVELNNYHRGEDALEGTYVVKAKSYHEENSTLVYGLEKDGQHYLVGEMGVGKYPPLSEKVRSAIKSFVSEEKPFVVDLENVDEELRLQFQEYLFSLGVYWIDGDRVASTYTFDRFEVGKSKKYSLSHSYGHNSHPSIDLLTGEVTTKTKEYTMEELTKLVGHNFKVVK